MSAPESLEVGPTESGVVFVLAHGAGGSKRDPLLVALAAELGRRGHGVARFDFAYREAGRKLPDRQPALLATYRSVLAHLRTLPGVRHLLVGGKSMGGRMATLLAAEAEPVSGVLALGYPLHPAKRPEKLRDAHLPAIAVPALFLSGTRDPLCDLDLMRPRVAAMQRATLLELEQGDHSLGVPKRANRTRAEVIGWACDAAERVLVEPLLAAR